MRTPASIPEPTQPEGSQALFARSIFGLLVVFCIVYLCALANFNLSIDDETSAVRSNSDIAVWVAQGRWTIFLIETYLVNRPVVVFFPLFVFGLFSAVAYRLTLRVNGLPWQDYRSSLLFVTFCAFPTLFFIINFSANLVGLGIGLLASCGAMFVFQQQLENHLDPRQDWRRWVGALAVQIALISIAVGAYQSLILLQLTCYAGVLLCAFSSARARPMKDWVMACVVTLLVVIASVALSELLSHFIRELTERPAAYTGSFLRLDWLLASPLQVLLTTAKDYLSVYGGSAAVYGFRYLSIPALLLLGLAGFAHRVRTQPRKRVALYLILLIGLSWIPFLFNLFTGGHLPYRTLVAVPYVVWLTASFAVFCEHRVIRGAGIVLVVLLSVQSIYSLSFFQTIRRLALQHDQQLASRIYDRISTSVPDFDAAKTYKIDFYGSQPYQSVYADINESSYSGSFFAWDGGNPRRIVSFMRVSGYGNLIQLPTDQRAALLPIMQAMPTWPGSGSVRAVDDVILVRLGETPGAAHQTSTPATP